MANLDFMYFSANSCYTHAQTRTWPSRQGEENHYSSDINIVIPHISLLLYNKR